MNGGTTNVINNATIKNANAIIVTAGYVSADRTCLKLSPTSDKVRKALENQPAVPELSPTCDHIAIEVKYFGVLLKRYKALTLHSPPVVPAPLPEQDADLLFAQQ